MKNHAPHPTRRNVAGAREPVCGAGQRNTGMLAQKLERVTCVRCLTMIEGGATVGEFLMDERMTNDAWNTRRAAIVATIDPDAQCKEHGCARHRCDKSHGDES